MNNDFPNDPKAALEARLTALLLGELSEAEAAEVRVAIAQDPALAKLRARLARTIDLVRDAAATAMEPAAAPVASLKLSDERRQKLLAHFKTVAPQEFVPRRQRELSWLVPMAAAIVILLIGAFAFLPTLSKAKFGARYYDLVGSPYARREELGGTLQDSGERVGEMAPSDSSQPPQTGGVWERNFADFVDDIPRLRARAAVPTPGLPGRTSNDELLETTSRQNTDVAQGAMYAAAEPLQDKSIQLHFSNPSNLEGIVKATLTDARSSVRADAGNGRLLVQATEKEMKTVADLMMNLDNAPRQVLIEPRLLETGQNPQSLRGIDWGATLEASRPDSSGAAGTQPTMSGPEPAAGQFQFNVGSTREFGDAALASAPAASSEKLNDRSSMDQAAERLKELAPQRSSDGDQLGVSGAPGLRVAAWNNVQVTNQGGAQGGGGGFGGNNGGGGNNDMIARGDIGVPAGGGTGATVSPSTGLPIPTFGSTPRGAVGAIGPNTGLPMRTERAFSLAALPAQPSTAGGGQGQGQGRGESVAQQGARPGLGALADTLPAPRPAPAQPAQPAQTPGESRPDLAMVWGSDGSSGANPPALGDSPLFGRAFRSQSDLKATESDQLARSAVGAPVTGLPNDPGNQIKSLEKDSSGRTVALLNNGSRVPVQAEFLGYDDPGPFIGQGAVGVTPLTSVLPLPMNFRLMDSGDTRYRRNAADTTIALPGSVQYGNDGWFSDAQSSPNLARTDSDSLLGRQLTEAESAASVGNGRERFDSVGNPTVTTTSGKQAQNAVTDLATIVPRPGVGEAGARTFTGSGAGAAGGGGNTPGVTVAPDTAGNRLVIRASGSELSQISNLLAKVDKPASPANEEGVAGVYKMRVDNVDAQLVMNALKEVFPARNTTANQSAPTTAAGTPILGRGRGTSTTTTGTGRASAGTQPQASTSYARNGTANFTYDPDSRNLVIVSDDDTMAKVSKVVAELDKKSAAANQPGNGLLTDTGNLMPAANRPRPEMAGYGSVVRTNLVIPSKTAVQDGLVLFEMGRADEAEAMFQKARDLDPNNQSASYYLNLVKEQRNVIGGRERGNVEKEMLTRVSEAWIPDSRANLPVPNSSARQNATEGEAGIQPNSAAQPLHTRYYRIDSNAFYSGLQGVTATTIAGSGGGSGGNNNGGGFGGNNNNAAGFQNNQGGGVVAGAATGAGGLAGVTSVENRVAPTTAAQAFFKSLGFDLTPPNVIVYNDRTGTLMVRADLDELDAIEKVTKALTASVPTNSSNALLAYRTVEDRPIRRPATNAPIPQAEIQAADNAFSTFSLNVSDVAFKLAAASLEKGQMPDAASVRSEEFINAFDYRDPEPKADMPVGFAWERARYPFAHNRDLLRFSVKTGAAGRQQGRPLNLVLLLDNSGSMERSDRAQIIREALRVLASLLQPQDKISVITFSRTARLWVDGVAGNQAGEVFDQVGSLTPQGGTNLEEAMNLAYATALKHYLANGMNRVVILTDGAANLGNVEPEALKQKVEAHRKQGVALDAFGIGWEGFNDDLLETLTRNGDGRYGFINSPAEAATEFAGQLAGALKVAASDVKVQVEFNPKRVTSYRQIGYAKHQLTKEQFRDNTVDAAELAAQEAGNALYTVEVNPAGSGPICTVRVRFKVPGTTQYREHAWDVPFNGNAVAMEQASPAMRLAATASAFSEWLVASPYAGEVTPDRLLGYLSGVPEICGADERPKKLEWMIRQAKSVVGK